MTSPSSGASGALQPRLDVAVSTVRERGYDVIVGKCMDGTGHISAPRRSARPSCKGCSSTRGAGDVPPWGGETAIDLVPLLDWDAIATAEPTWVVGFSDMSTLITPLTLVAGWATIHGNNLMDTPYRIPEGLVGWLDIVELESGATFTQVPPDHHRRSFVDYETQPDVDEFVLDVPGAWTRLDAGTGDLDVTGRLIGGCIETLANLAGTRYLDTTRLAGLGDGLIVYVEASGDDAATICRNLHGMRLNGVFEGAAAVLVGRTYAPDIPSMTQHEAAADALGGLGVRCWRTSSAATGRRTCRSSTARGHVCCTPGPSRPSRRHSPEPPRREGER